MRERWEKNGWLGAGKKPVTNRDLWERLIAETRRHEVIWHKVRGHSGDVMNERVDAPRPRRHRHAVPARLRESSRPASPPT